MIKLKDISAKTIIPYDAYAIKELIEITGAESVADVLELTKKYPNYNWSVVYDILEGNFERVWNLANKRGYVPKIFTTKGYSDEELKKQDSFNNGGILLVSNPTTSGIRNRCLENKTIRTIKSDLAHTYADGENYVIGANFIYRNIGEGSIPNLITSIEMYEEQIERQAQLTKERDINLFELHKEEKIDIVEEMYNEIIMYLLYNADERLVWNVLSDSKRKAYLSSAINKKQEDIKARETIKEYIANYTTIKELEKVANHKLKVLKRFIVK